MNPYLVTSICVFGSVARDTADTISDRDVLIVVGDPALRREISRKWKSDGWSVSAYSPRRFMAMANAGSLFVQHLKHEGLVIEDRHGWLKECLRVAKIKPNYAQDARESLDLARPIERFAQDMTLVDYPIVADLAFVSVRNFGINYLAQRGRLVFDYAQIVDELAEIFALSKQERDLLAILRFGKLAYRSGRSCAGIWGITANVRAVTHTLFGEGLNQTISAHAPIRNLGSGYARLRDFEAAVIVKASGCLKEPGLAPVWDWVQNPREYSWQVRQFDPCGSAMNSQSGCLLR